LIAFFRPPGTLCDNPTALVLTPVFHRVLHRFHVSEED